MDKQEQLALIDRRFGRRIASVRAEAWQESTDVPIAAANAHFLLDPRESDAP